MMYAQPTGVQYAGGGGYVGGAGFAGGGGGAAQSGCCGTGGRVVAGGVVVNGGGGGGGNAACCAGGDPGCGATCLSDGACGAIACGTAACGAVADGPGQLTYVGGGSGSYRNEYAYVGMGLGDFEYVAPRRPTYCVCWVTLSLILLLLILLALLFGPETATTTPAATCDVFACPMNSKMKAAAATIRGIDVVSCCDKTCGGYICATGYTLKMNSATIIGADVNACCDRKMCSSFQCPALYMPKAAGSGVAGQDTASCCDITCGHFHCADGTRLKAGASRIRGQSQEMCCQAHKKICIIYGDPHSESFDGHHNDYYTSGEFWIIKSRTVNIQGRYLPTHITRGLSVTKELTFGGIWLGNKVLRMSSTSITWDGAAICTSFPSSYSAPGFFDITYNDHGKILQPHRELGKNLKVLHINFHDGTFAQVNQWTNPEEGFFVNLMVEMNPVSGQDGACGNFNGIEADDDRNEIRKRFGGIPDVKQADLIGFQHKTPIKSTEDGYPSISLCESNLLMSAHAVCQKEEGHYIPSMHCLAKKCNDNKGSLVAH